ncbi:DUF6998 domain-containing protein [Caballeronia udeis]
MVRAATAYSSLRKYWAEFTLDGRLVGDVTEALALHHFDLAQSD